MNERFQCPKCGEECWRDEVDIGVGVIHGPHGCPGCGWSELEEYDRSEGISQAQKEHPDWYVDQFGGMIHLNRIEENLTRLGLDGKKIVGEEFRS